MNIEKSIEKGLKKLDKDLEELQKLNNTYSVYTKEYRYGLKREIDLLKQQKKLTELESRRIVLEILKMSIKKKEVSRNGQ